MQSLANVLEHSHNCITVMQMQCNDFFLNPQNRYKAICDVYFSNKDGSPTIICEYSTNKC